MIIYAPEFHDHVKILERLLNRKIISIETKEQFESLCWGTNKVYTLYDLESKTHYQTSMKQNSIEPNTIFRNYALIMFGKFEY